MNRKDWTLIAIDAADTKGLSPVQLQKTLFLLGQEMTSAVGSDFYDFQPYNYGPFDRQVYQDAEKLAEVGEVEITQRPGENWNRYVVTQAGAVRASMLHRETPKASAYVNELVEWVLRQNFQELVRAIYAKYPDMRANSVFQG